MAGLAECTTGLAKWIAGLAECTTGLAKWMAGSAEYTTGLAKWMARLAEFTTGLAKCMAGLAECTTGLAKWMAGLAECTTGLSFCCLCALYERHNFQRCQNKASSYTVQCTSTSLSSTRTCKICERKLNKVRIFSNCSVQKTVKNLLMQ